VSHHSRRTIGVALAAALASLLLHLAAGPGHLDDVDAINFTLGVRAFDVARHQPHPPGYPVLVAAAKLAALPVRAIAPMLPARWTAVPIETIALSLIAMIAGAAIGLALLPVARAACGGDDEAAIGAVLIALACPLVFVTASRPLSDAPGLAAAIGVQALLATAFVRQRGWRDREVPPAELAATGRLIVLAALAAGLAAGLRTQTAWLTLPLLALVIADRAGRAAAAAILGSGVMFTLGALLWAVPLVMASGGPGAYWHAISSQAGEDYEGVDMLFTSPRPLWRLAMNLLQTFVLPWGPLPLALAVLSLAAIGALVLLRRDRRAWVLLAAAFGPYLAFHLVWQENVTTRYALPIVPAVAILAATAWRAAARAVPAAAAGAWVARAAAAALVAVLLGVSLPALHAYTGEPAPVFRLFADMRAGVGARSDIVVAAHRLAYSDTARARVWAGPAGFPWRLLPAPSGHEWLEMVRYWREGGTGRMWLLADRRRTDLALIDPASQVANGHYAWSTPFADGVLGGTRPGTLDWVVVASPPAWFLGEGWALSPEIAGIADADGKGPARGGATGWIRRSDVPRRLIVGGRNLGGPGAPAARFTLAIAGRVADTWDVAATPGFFLRSLDRPLSAQGPDAGGLDEIVINSVAADGSGRVVPTAIEQFGLQPLDRIQFAYGEGWHEDEYQPRTGLRWRWSSGRAALQVWPVDRDVRVTLVFESPLKTFDDAPIVSMTAGARELARLTPRDAFSIDVVVPAADLAAAGGRLVIATSRTFVPAEHVGAGDPRHGDRRALGLRLLDASVAGAGTPVPQR